MATQTLETRVITSEKLEQLQAEIQQEFVQFLNNAQFIAILEKYGISDPGILDFSSAIDLSKIQVIDAETVAKYQSFLPKNTADTNTQSTTAWYNPCPMEGYPKGCWL